MSHIFLNIKNQILRRMLFYLTLNPINLYTFNVMSKNPLATAFIFALSLVSSTSYAQDRLYDNEFPLSDVKLLDSPFRHAMELNVETLLKYDVDRLLAPYLKEAGLEPKAPSFSNWDGLDGHVGGHYLSALAIHYAATSDSRLKERMDYMISELGRAQKTNGDGYIGGVPGSKSFWPLIKAGEVGEIWNKWVPWYNVHKMYAGLRDVWLYAGDEKAKKMFVDFCDWGIDIISNLSDTQMEDMLNNEFGGMDEVYADAYAMTGDQKYMDAARRFSHHWLLDSMAAGVDNLDNKHANTQVPKVVGYQRIAELSGDKDYERAARFFFSTVADTRSLAFGGNSRREHFPSKDDCKSYTEEREGPENCNSYNMLKIAEGLHRMRPDAKMADFYERVMFNHILSTQHPGHGGYVYFTPARPAHYRVYSQPNQAMWCCVGTGMENHGKYGEFIYTHSADSLWVNLFVPSRLDWKEKGLTLTQTTEFPKDGKITLDIYTGKARNFTMMLRFPGWAESMTVMVNGKVVDHSVPSGNYIALDRKWKNGDKVEIEMPMTMRVEEMPNVPDYIAIMRGPILLGARCGSDNLVGLLADDTRWAHIAHGPLVSVFDTPLIIGERNEVVEKIRNIQTVDDDRMLYRIDSLFDPKFSDIMLEPFANIHDSRYNIYWLNMSPEAYAAHIDKEMEIENARLALDRRTVDAVNAGEQQPEADHFMFFEKSSRGNHSDQAWRDASDGGFFGYRLKTDREQNLALMVRYWGNEKGNRAFDIYVDDQILASENITGKWNRDEFVDVVYDIPATMIEGKDFINVKFMAKPANVAGGIFFVRLVKPE